MTDQEVDNLVEKLMKIYDDFDQNMTDLEARREEAIRNALEDQSTEELESIREQI